MPNDLDQLLGRRQVLLTELQSIQRLRRGTLSRQTFAKKGDPSSTRGPYYVLQGFHKGKKFSRRIPADQAEQVQKHVNNFRRFQELADQCVTLTDQITQMEQTSLDSKKNSSPPKSKKSNSKRPKLS